MNLNIYYFSGTGNCLAISKRIAEQIEGAKIYSIAELTRRHNEKYKDNAKNVPIEIRASEVLFVFPSYAYKMPHFVKKFIENAKIESDYIATVCSYGSVAGAVYTQMQKILKRKKLGLSFSAGVHSVENYRSIFRLPPDDVVRAEVERETKTAHEIAKRLLCREINSPKKPLFLVHFVAFLFNCVFRIFAKFYRVTKDCNGCQICGRLCPTSAITYKKNKKPKFSTKCAHCQGCLNACPKNAIRFAGYTKKSRRYLNPNVKVTEINQNFPLTQNECSNDEK